MITGEAESSSCFSSNSNSQMDLAEKRRQLEEIRAAREAKQRSVLQQQQLQLQKGGLVTTFVGSSNSSGNSISAKIMAGNMTSGIDTLKRASSTASSLTIREERRTGEFEANSTRRPPPAPMSLVRSSSDKVTAAHDDEMDPAKKLILLDETGGKLVGGTWKMEVGVGALNVKPTVATTFDIVKDGVLGIDKVDEFHESEVKTRRRVISLQDTAMLITHSLRADSFFNCKDRCVLDVRVLCSNLTENNKSKDEDFLLVAAAFSEVCNVDVKGDNYSQSISGVRSGDTPLTSSSSTATSIVEGENIGAAKGLVLLCCIPRENSSVGDRVCNVLPLYFDSEIRVLTYTHHRPQLLFGGASNGCVVVWRIDHALRSSRVAVTMTMLKITEPNYTIPSLSLSPVIGEIHHPNNNNNNNNRAAVGPSAQSFPSPHAHQTRVLSMAVHGDANYHHLYSVSQDGRVCMWAPLQLQLPLSSRNGVIAGQQLGHIASCAAFVDKAADAMSKVIVGCIDGHVLEGRAKSSQIVEMRSITTSTSSYQELLSKKATTTTENELAAHNAAVVAVAPHPLHADPRIGDTILTAGADGRCNLWLGSRRIVIDGFSAKVNCLRWSPTNPAVFVAGESNGRVAAWDLTTNSYSPVTFVYLRSNSISSYTSSSLTLPSGGGMTQSSSQNMASNASSYRETGVTSLSFSEDGTWLVCGTADGEVHLLHLPSELFLQKKDSNVYTEGIVGDNNNAPITNNNIINNNNNISDTASAGVDGGYTVPSWIDARFVS